MIRFLFVLLFVSASADRVCYPDLGCFNNLPPFLDIPNRPVSPLPESREEVGTEFVLNTPANNFDFEYDVISNLVPGSLTSSHFDPSLETKILVHGYGESGYSDWITAMGRAFLTVGDYNIIRVDWFKGAFEFYPTATSNGRLVGAEISLLMDNIAAVYPNTVAANAANYHIVGYSLGAHVAGYAGERQPNLARITALDPSSPYFENTATQVRLDETDAAFVDVIHTDTDPRIQRGYGMYSPCGHMDFYPNGGREQPGCDFSIIEYLPLNPGGVYDGGFSFVPCNHRRAHEIFIETILKNGAKPCGAFPTSTSNLTSFYDEVFDTLPPAVEMGFQSDSYKPVGEVNVIYQRRTTEFSAYGFQYRVTITFGDPGRSADEAVGELFLTINGDQNTIYRTKLDDTGHYEPGATYTFYIFTEDYPGNILHLGFSWLYDRDWYKPWTWPVFSTPDVYIDNIKVELLEDSSRYTFCGDGDKYKSNEEEDRVVHLC